MVGVRWGQVAVLALVGPALGMLAAAEAPAEPETAASEAAIDPTTGDFWTTENLVDLITTYGLPALGALLVIFVAYIVSAWVSRGVSRSCVRRRLMRPWRSFW